jgi:tetratricopeptide (TPR) repeat protein
LEFDNNNFEAWNNRGYCNYMLKRWGEGIRDLNKALELNKDWALSWNNRGLIYL